MRITQFSGTNSVNWLFIFYNIYAKLCYPVYIANWLINVSCNIYAKLYYHFMYFVKKSALISVYLKNWSKFTPSKKIDMQK